MFMDRVMRVLSMPSVAHPAPELVEDPIALYRTLRYYYHSTDLYASLAAVARLNDEWAPAMKGLRNPAHRVVEFYVAHLWPDEFNLVTPDGGADAAELEALIERVWQWSNWGAKRRLAARWFSNLGDLFIKVVSVPDAPKVYFQIIDPEHVVDFDTDERGFLTYLHIEVARVMRRERETREVVHTEIWDKAAGTFCRWERDRHVAVGQLGRPTEERPLSYFGIDFIPVVHAMFQDVGNPRGAGAFTHALDKIDEANMHATRLHQMLFRHNDATWALQANGMDPTGRPLPPPNITGSNGSSADSGTVTLGGSSFVRLPGMSTLVPLVPNIHYGDALAVLNAQIQELEQDLPELAFHRVREKGDISGRAARIMMTDAIDKILEARGNAMQALVRANQMALTMGKAIGIEEFTGLGEFDDGGLDHHYEPRDAIAITETEHWELEQAKAEAAKAQQESGVSVAATLRDRGYSDDEIARMQLERDGERSSTVESVLANFDRGQA